MAKRLNTNVFYFKHGSIYVIIGNNYWNTLNQQPKQTRSGGSAQSLFHCILVRKGKTIVKQ